jgi:hypothetical protein
MVLIIGSDLQLISKELKELKELKVLKVLKDQQEHKVP